MTVRRSDHAFLKEDAGAACYAAVVLYRAAM
jgi:hypothetical protein